MFTVPSDSGFFHRHFTDNSTDSRCELHLLIDLDKTLPLALENVALTSAYFSVVFRQVLLLINMRNFYLFFTYLRPPPGATCTLTDLDTMLPLMSENVALNDLSDTVRVAELAW